MTRIVMLTGVIFLVAACTGPTDRTPDPAADAPAPKTTGGVTISGSAVFGYVKGN